VKYFVTGGYGFIGSHFVDLLLHEGHEVIIYDKLTYATKLNYNTGFDIDIFKDKVQFKQGDIADAYSLHYILRRVKPDIIVNFCAESHVDRSLNDENIFITTNTLGVKNMLDWCKESLETMFLQVSTDEVGGSWSEGSFNEDNKLFPRNPYSASKAMAEMLCMAYGANFGVKYIITRGSNTYGPRQWPEKLIPKTIINLMQNKQVPIYDNGVQIRDWLYVKDHVKGIKFAIDHGNIGEIYHIGGEDERVNIDVINLLFSILGKTDELKDWTATRKGHDFRYSLDCSKLKNLGWKQEHHFEHEILDTVKYYKMQKHLNHI
jgi:dTDP-glucose 4,6-dehydratase